MVCAFFMDHQMILFVYGYDFIIRTTFWPPFYSLVIEIFTEFFATLVFFVCRLYY